VVVGKARVVPRVHLTAAARHSPVVLELVALEVLAGTVAVAAVEGAGLAAAAVERITILAALRPGEEGAGLRMQTRL
jgi:hypothetical protein